MKRGLQICCVVVAIIGGMPGWASGKSAVITLPPGSPLKVEHFAFSHTSNMYLDGPKLEAQCPVHRSGSGGFDADGNAWFGHGNVGLVNSIGGRCIEKGSDMIRPYFSDDYWTGFDAWEEGPGRVFPTLMKPSGLGVPKVRYFISGSPLKGLKHGYFIFSNRKSALKVWLDVEKDEWWFKTIVGGGTKPLPRLTGERVGARDVKIQVEMVQVMPDGRLIIFSRGGFYEYKEEDESLVCLLGLDDYKNDTTMPKVSGRFTVPATGVLGGDGTFYLCTYFGSGYSGRSPSIWRMVPGKKVEPYAWAINKAGFFDGPAMASGAHCGHHIWPQMHNYKYLPSDVLLITAHDEINLRRIRNGRVSSLCADGEWRELKKMDRSSGWFFGGCAPGPGGVAVAENMAVSTSLPYIITGIDYAKETVGPPNTPTIPAWPIQDTGKKED